MEPVISSSFDSNYSKIRKSEKRTSRKRGTEEVGTENTLKHQRGKVSNDTEEEH
jgi:hypothetical protein